MGVNKRLDRLEAATQAAREEKIRRDYEAARDSFTDEDIDAIHNMAAGDDLLIRWWEFCQMHPPPEEQERLDRIIAKIQQVPGELAQSERLNALIEKAYQRRK